MKNAQMNEQFRIADITEKIDLIREWMKKAETSAEIIRARRKAEKIDIADSWERYFNLSADDQTNLLVRAIYSAGRRTVGRINRNAPIDKCDYILLNNWGTVADNLWDVVGETWGRCITVYQYKYDSAERGISNAIASAIYKVSREGHDGKTSALYVTSENGEERCVVDLEWERYGHYSSVEDTAIFNACLDAMGELDRYVADEVMDRATYTEIAGDVGTSVSTVSRWVKNMKRYF